MFKGLSCRKRACFCYCFQPFDDDYCSHHGCLHPCKKNISWRGHWSYSHSNGTLLSSVGQAQGEQRERGRDNY
ncbi:hypothetical protein GLYMA_14G161701v4 [Glycine max]|nr:hypothetical protein GLYMA_14G161701v4 [Glycine max]